MLRKSRDLRESGVSRGGISLQREPEAGTAHRSLFDELLEPAKDEFPESAWDELFAPPKDELVEPAKDELLEPAKIE
jgi:hypothetical protein